MSTPRQVMAQNSHWNMVIAGLSAGAVGLGAVGPAASTRALAIAVAAGMLAIGLPHGALDLLLIGRARVANRGLALVAYVALVGLSVVAFRIAPTLGLLLFLAGSAWHFGQADAWRWGGLPTAWALSRGLAVVGGLLLAHPLAVAGVIADLGAELALPGTRGARLVLGVLFSVHLGVSAALPRARATFAESALLCAMAAVLQPTAFFGLYFLLWHSAPHLWRVVGAGPKFASAEEAAEILLLLLLLLLLHLLLLLLLLAKLHTAL